MCRVGCVSGHRSHSVWLIFLVLSAGFAAPCPGRGEEEKAAEAAEAATATETEAETATEEPTSIFTKPKWLYFSPTRVMGSVGFGYTRGMASNIKPEAEHRTLINISVTRSVAGYIWKPWMALWNGDIQLNFNSAQRVIHLTSNKNVEDSDMLNRVLGGNFNLAVLPRSRFPFKAYIQQNQMDSSEGVAADGSGTLRRRYGISQQYQTEDSNTQASVNFDGFREIMGTKDHNGYHGLSFPAVGFMTGRAAGDALTMRGNTRFEQQVLDIAARRVRSESLQADSVMRSRELGAVVNHDYTGEGGWTLTSVGDVTRLWNYSELLNRGPALPSNLPPGCQANAMPYWNDADFLTHQLSNTFFWRDQTEPFTINASSRYSRVHDWQGTFTNTQNCQNQLPNGGMPDPTQPPQPQPQPQSMEASDAGRLQQMTDLNLGMNYMLLPNLSVNSTSTGTFMDSRSGDSRDRFYRAGGNTNFSFDPQGAELGPFSYRWFAGGGMNSSFADGFKPMRITNQRIGHGIGHAMPVFANTNLSSSISETFAAFQQSNHAGLWLVNHTGSMQMDRSEGRSRSFGSVSVSDNRSLGDILGNSQTMNLQLSHSMESGEGSTLTGNMTNQWGRMSNGETGVLFTRYSFIDINYTNANLFDLPGLRFSSMARFGAPAMLPLGRYAGYETRSWWNRIDYQIGKIVVSLTGMVQESSAPEFKSNTDGLVLFELRRYFDTKF